MEDISMDKTTCGLSGGLKEVLVFSGYNQRAVIAFLRTLEQRKIKYHIIASSVDDPIFLTVYQNRIVYVRKFKQLDLDDLICGIRTILSKNDGCDLLIAPSTEALNRFLLEHRKEIENEHCVIPLVGKKLYEQISDKYSFGLLCSQYGIQIPPEVDMRHDDGRYEPVIAKPKSYYSSDGKVSSPVFLLSDKEIKMFVETHDINEFVFQKYLCPGQSYYLLFYFSRDGKVYSLSQQNIAQQSDGKSILAAKISTIHQDKIICSPYIHMLKSEGFFGLIMIEVRCFDGKWYMIEANPRFWGPSQLFCDAGCNFFELFLEDYGVVHGSTEMPQNIDWNEEYYWSGGFRYTDLSVDCVWYENEYLCDKDKLTRLQSADIYRRNDTMDIYYSEELNNLYRESSKHSQYQILPKSLNRYIRNENLQTIARFEEERLRYILLHVSVEGKKVLDIGANTGYFSIRAIEEGAKQVICYEGNKTHARFIETAAEALHNNEKIEVNDEYYTFDQEQDQFDIVFCLNVVHHLGDDFSDESSKGRALEKMMGCINTLARCTNILVFQMGFNWKGDRKSGLFERGTKREMINFIQFATKEQWDILSIGIPEKHMEKIEYMELNDNNIIRKDELGEFLNRPLFIMKSKEYHGACGRE